MVQIFYSRLQASGFWLGYSVARYWLPAFCITTNARRTSFSKLSNSTVSTIFFGLITTSTSGVVAGLQSLTASRKRRLIRLRCTAPPKHGLR